MDIPRLTLALACSALLAPLSSLAQTKPAVPVVPAAPAASAPVPGASAVPPRDPRVLSPEEKRDNATAGTELRPERPVVPQVKVPLKQTEPLPAAGTASGGVDDGAARCLAMKSRNARTECQARLQESSRPQAR